MSENHNTYERLSITLTKRNLEFLDKIEEEYNQKTGMGFVRSRHIQELLNKEEDDLNERK